jgi:hypothetical protein
VAKIKFYKSEIYFFGKSKDLEESYKDLFGCESGTFPFKYLGIPTNYRKLRNDEWKPVEERFATKLGNWIGKLLSYEDMLILINLVITTLPMFMLLFFEILKGVGKRLNFYRSRFFLAKRREQKEI